MDDIILKKAVQGALAEDRVRQDITSRLLISREHSSQAHIIVKAPAVLCGADFLREVFHQIDPQVECLIRFQDGAMLKKNTCLATIKGPTRSILAGERTALNFLGYLSGIATQTQKFVMKVKPYKTKILATRKTTPGNRLLEKYAVITGGGFPHRYHLGDMILIKDNHRVVYRRIMSLPDAIRSFQKHATVPIEVEVDNLKEFQLALEASPDMILLDNMSLADLRKAVALTQRYSASKRPLLEASGGITLDTVREIARTGVDRISVGALTHSHHFINVSMEFIP